jgi:hypothetical protein
MESLRALHSPGRSLSGTGKIHFPEGFSQFFEICKFSGNDPSCLCNMAANSKKTAICFRTGGGPGEERRPTGKAHAVFWKACGGCCS